MDTHPSWGDIEHQETDLELTVPVSDALRLRAELPGLDPDPHRVCTGHLDRLIVPETARFLAEHVPHARLARLEPAGHMAVFERHDRLVSELSVLADEVLAPGGPLEPEVDKPAQQLHV